MIKGSSGEVLHPFSINDQVYSQKTYYGRFMTLLQSQNPFNFFLPHSKIEAAKLLVDEETKIAKNLKPGENLFYSEEKIRRIRAAQGIVSSAIHPDTGEYIPRIFRICSYAPMSVPVLFGMILSKPTTFNIVFWQWANQTYSAGVNYANRNMSGSLNTQKLLTAYSVAVMTSISIGLGMKKLFSPLLKNSHGPNQLFANFFITLAAVGSAAWLNLMIMRSEEIKNGITLVDHEGNDRGKSKAIGLNSVVKTALTRFLMPVPALIMPTITFYYLEKNNWNPKNKIARLSLESIVFFIWLGFGPLFSCSVFEQMATTGVNGLEPEFQNLTDSKGNPVTEFYYNKGL